MEYLKDLNEPQKQAVLTTEGPLLIVAGAGAGTLVILPPRAGISIWDELIFSLNWLVAVKIYILRKPSATLARALSMISRTLKVR